MPHLLQLSPRFLQSTEILLLVLLYLPELVINYLSSKGLNESLGTAEGLVSSLTWLLPRGGKYWSVSKSLSCQQLIDNADVS